MGKTKISEKSLEATPNLEDMEQEEESLEVTQTGVNGTLEEEELLESGTTGALQVEASKWPTREIGQEQEAQDKIWEINKY